MTVEEFELYRKSEVLGAQGSLTSKADLVGTNSSQLFCHTGACLIWKLH